MIPARHGRRRQKGFSLIEIMVAMLVMALLSLMAWRGLDSIITTSDRLTSAREDNAAVLRAIRQLDQDLRLRATLELTAALPTSQRRSFLPPSVQVERAGQGQTRLGVVRAASAEPGRWQRVQWWVANGTLYRAAAPGTNDLPIPAPRAADATALLTGVQGFEVRAWLPDAGWVPAATVPQGRSQAEALEVRFTLRDGQGGGGYRRVVRLQ
ncbi:general secretion pathway protein J [Bordetella ansorpii]|uniref:Type II secretion system protein J n=1 Tax=Bordetella ansorpii TaxID=288768 RepID=A0A157QNH3_9BORD|nr:prepilin-type N-terminal cleavage/methylation domain-containing protein [Bordetella ansorpii]SAI47198.1 general secretion pathway protein J [Bordetella ansorpii]